MRRLIKKLRRWRVTRGVRHRLPHRTDFKRSIIWLNALLEKVGADEDHDADFQIACARLNIFLQTRWVDTGDGFAWDLPHDLAGLYELLRQTAKKYPDYRFRVDDRLWLFILYNKAKCDQIFRPKSPDEEESWPAIAALHRHLQDAYSTLERIGAELSVSAYPDLVIESLPKRRTLLLPSK